MLTRRALHGVQDGRLCVVLVTCLKSQSIDSSLAPIARRRAFMDMHALGTLLLILYILNRSDITLINIFEASWDIIYIGGLLDAD
jgi:hypothetical protein